MKKHLCQWILVLLLGLPAYSSEEKETLPIDPEVMKAQTKWALNLIRSKHYLKGEIGQLEGTAIIQSYVELFDYSKLYFLKSDIESYNFRFGDSIESFLQKGNLYPAFTIYEDFKAKVLARYEWISHRLTQPFSFKEIAVFQTDRSESNWPESLDQADLVWEHYLKYQLLNEILSLSGKIPVLNEIQNQKDVGETLSLETLKLQLQQLIEDPLFFEEKMREAKKKIARRYERNKNFILEWEKSDLQESFINSVTSVFDPHSSFLSSHTLEGFNSSVKNSFVGIGALLEDIDGICTIKEVLPGGPAERSKKIQANDEIHGVAQGDDAFEDVVDMQLKYIVRKIKGEKGTQVRLLIKPAESSDPSERKIVALERDEVKLTANLASAKILQIPKEDTQEQIPVGVITLPSFYGNIGIGNAVATTSEDVKELIVKLKALGAKGLILDLRSNGGGLLSEAVKLTGLFIPVGPVVQVVDAKGKKQVLYDQDPDLFWEGPLIVLTSKMSASASEIVAGALQDNERALIIGDRSTHGKGTVQEVYYMNSPREFNWFQPRSFSEPPVASKITIKQFFLPQGSSTQLKGVASDIVLPSINEIAPIGESEYDNPIPWQSIEAVNWYNNWEKINVSSPYNNALLSYLKERSLLRQNSLDEFLYIQDKIDWREELKELTAISLNLDDRIEKQFLDRKRIDSLNEQFELLKEASFDQEAVLLDLRIQQEEDSALLESEDESELSHEDESPVFDIHLRESARIMRDWVNWEEASTAPEKPKEGWVSDMSP